MRTLPILAIARSFSTMLMVTSVSCGSATPIGSSPGPTSDSGSCGCVDVPLEWGDVGGFTPSSPVSSLTPCGAFLHREPSKPPMRSCTQEVAECAGIVSPAQVTLAVAESDVQAAIAAAPIVYGADPRPADGQVFRVQVNGKIIDVGLHCSNTPGACTPIPDGVQRLVTLLKTVTTQQLQREPCRSQFL